MKIERHLIPRDTIEAFAVRNNLVMEVYERNVDDKDSDKRFYAHFKYAEVKEGSMLRGSYGDGPTEDAAIRNYANEISGQLLVIKAFSKERHEIRVPIISGTKWDSPKYSTVQRDGAAE